VSAGQEEKQDRERRTGQQQEAQEHLAVATAMYREMDMSGLGVMNDSSRV
jgi:hypothetical protein